MPRHTWAYCIQSEGAFVFIIYGFSANAVTVLIHGVTCQIQNLRSYNQLVCACFLLWCEGNFENNWIHPGVSDNRYNAHGTNEAHYVLFNRKAGVIHQVVEV